MVDILIKIGVSIVGIIVGGLLLSFLIATPIRLINTIRYRINRNTRHRISEKCYYYINKNNLNNMDLRGIFIELGMNPLSNIGRQPTDIWVKVYTYLYNKYDPQRREDVINEILDIKKQ